MYLRDVLNWQRRIVLYVWRKRREGIQVVVPVARRKFRDSCVYEWVFVKMGEEVWCIEDVSDGLYPLLCHLLAASC